MSVIERVAREIAAADEGYDAWDEMTARERRDYCRTARWCIRAMREPTAAMLEATKPAFEQINGFIVEMAMARGRPLIPHPEGPPLTRAYRAMIDEALNETEQSDGCVDAGSRGAAWTR